MANGGMSTAEIEAGIKGMLNMSFLQKTAEERQISNSKEGELKITIRNEKKGKSRQQQGSKESPPEKSEIESNNSSSKKGNVKRDSKISKKKIKESQSSKVSKTLDEAQPIVEQIDLVTQATQPSDDLKQMGGPRNMTTPQNSEQPKQKKKHTNKNRSGNGPKDSKKETGNVTPASNKKPSLEIYRPKSYKNNATGLQLQTRDDTQDQNPRRSQQSPEPNKTTGQTQKDTPGKSIGKEDQATQEELTDLQEQFIFPLKKKSLKFPKARFFCRICDYHCDTVEISKRHYKDNRHIRLIELKRGDALLKSLPKPCATHIACLDELIDEVYNTQSLGEECVKSRLEYLDALKVYLRQKLPALELEVYGSTVSGFGLKNSDVNVDVVLQQSDNPAYILTTIHEMLRDNENCYDSIQSDFSAKVPCITFREKSSKLSFQICVNNVSAHLTTKLLQLYSNMDPRVRKLGVAFRYWGQLCEIDRQHEGTLPSYSFNLMLVYYLQQCQPPILPSLDQLAAMVPKNMKGNVYTHIFEDDLQMDWTTSNTCSVGELWLGLLEFYSVTYEMTNYIISLRGNNLLRREEKRWNSKKIAIEDPFATKRNITRSVSHSQLYEYIVDRIRATYKYFSIPQTRKGPLFTKVDKTMSKSGPRNKAKKTEAKIEDLVKSDDVVIESDEIIDDNEEIVDTIDRLVTDEDDIVRNTHSDVPIADEDLDSLVELIDDTDLNESVINQHIDTTSIEDTVNSNCTQTITDEELRRFAGNLVINVISGAIATLKSVDDSTSTREAVQQPSTCETAKKSTSSQGGDNEQLEPFLHLENDEEFIESAVKYGIYRARIVGRLKRSDYAFLFKTETLTDGTGPAIICSICGKEGHLKKMCPDETLPALLPLPVPGKTYMQNLGAALHQLAFETMPTEQDDQRREQILFEIEDFVKELHPDASLSLFGSSCNGFGFRTSDLDICMTLGPKTSEDLDCVDIIEKLATKLRQCKGLYQVVPITTAKVPIVKFKHRRSQLEGDISLYNTLAQHNTDMLRMYSEIDSRVRILGYCLKHFAKICDIGDASRGSLSSYAYILMLLYFLQQRKPAVIPVLQEMYEGPDKPETLVDGWNAWFCPDGNLLTKLWHDYGKNKESVAELWIGFLRFYTEVFNFKDYVISIRSIKPLSCLEKLWNGKCIAIEDPFDLNHNLGAGVSRKMNTFIQKAFIKGRHIFGIPVDTPPRNYSNLLDYLFDPKLLTDGAPPNDRGCRICSKIGHFAKDCPVVQNRKERAARQREQREQWEHKQQEGGESPGKSRDNWRDNRPDRPRDSDNRNWRDKQGTEARPIPKTGNHGSQSPASTPSRGERTYYGSSSGQSPVYVAPSSGAQVVYSNPRQAQIQASLFQQIQGWEPSQASFTTEQRQGQAKYTQSASKQGQFSQSQQQARPSQSPGISRPGQSPIQAQFSHSPGQATFIQGQVHYTQGQGKNIQGQLQNNQSRPLSQHISQIPGPISRQPYTQCSPQSDFLVFTPPKSSTFQSSTSNNTQSLMDIRIPQPQRYSNIISSPKGHNFTPQGQGYSPSQGHGYSPGQSYIHAGPQGFSPGQGQCLANIDAHWPSLPRSPNAKGNNPGATVKPLMHMDPAIVQHSGGPQYIRSTSDSNSKHSNPAVKALFTNQHSDPSLARVTAASPTQSINQSFSYANSPPNPQQIASPLQQTPPNTWHARQWTTTHPTIRPDQLQVSQSQPNTNTHQMLTNSQAVYTHHHALYTQGQALHTQGQGLLQTQGQTPPTQCQGKHTQGKAIPQGYMVGTSQGHGSQQFYSASNPQQYYIAPGQVSPGSHAPLPRQTSQYINAVSSSSGVFHSNPQPPDLKPQTPRRVVAVDLQYIEATHQPQNDT